MIAWPVCVLIHPNSVFIALLTIDLHILKFSCTLRNFAVWIAIFRKNFDIIIHIFVSTFAATNLNKGVWCNAWAYFTNFYTISPFNPITFKLMTRKADRQFWFFTRNHMICAVAMARECGACILRDDNAMPIKLVFVKEKQLIFVAKRFRRFYPLQIRAELRYQFSPNYF